MTDSSRGSNSGLNAAASLFLRSGPYIEEKHDLSDVTARHQKGRFL